jgi:hypothetical protein
MSPGILQLQSVGMQDVYLTKDPEINIFKNRYYRYVNFATENVQLPLNERVNWGKRTSCDIKKHGHLLSKLYLHLQIPSISKKDGTYASWIDTLGYGLFSDAIELEIGGVIVDRLYPVFLDMWDELTVSPQDTTRKMMILKTDTWRSTIRTGDSEHNLVIPLSFWFTKSPSLALPILAMQSQDIKVHFKFKQFNECIHYDGDLEPDQIDIISASVFAEYVFLDDLILETYMNTKHQYVIDQVQYNGDESIGENMTYFKSVLKFNNPVKEILLCAIDKGSQESNNHFNYSRSSDGNPLILEIGMLLDGKRRFETYPEYYYRINLPDTVHSFISSKHMYCIPFAKKPEEIQPTGAINMTQFNDITLPLKMNSGNQETNLYVFALSHNVVTVENGVLVMEFVN